MNQWLINCLIGNLGFPGIGVILKNGVGWSKCNCPLWECDSNKAEALELQQVIQITKVVCLRSLYPCGSRVLVLLFVAPLKK